MMTKLRLWFTPHKRLIADLENCHDVILKLTDELEQKMIELASLDRYRRGETDGVQHLGSERGYLRQTYTACPHGYVNWAQCPYGCSKAVAK